MLETQHVCNVKHINYMKQLDISHRAEKTPPSPIRKLAAYADAASKTGTHVYRLNIGQPDLTPPKQFLDAVRNTKRPVVAYESSHGSSELLGTWSEYLNAQYALDISPEQMLITMGASEALIFSFMVCCDPGDEILIFDPTYANYMGFAAISGVRLVPLPCSLDDQCALPERSEIDRFISPYTRAVLLCNPNNPSGSVASVEELEMLLALCREKNLFLIVDETYREIVFDGLTPQSIFQIAPKDPNIIVVDSLSKRFSLCGSRIGCMITWHQEVMAAAMHIAQARLAAPSIEQDAAAEMLRTLDPTYVSQTVAEYTKRRDTALAMLADIPGVTSYAPEGGFYLLADLPVDDAEDFAIFMLRDFSHEGETVFVAPAAGFYMHREMGRRTMRIAFVLEEKDMKRALSVLKLGLEAYGQRTALHVAG